VQNPSVLKTIPFDPMMPVRFFSKLALAVAHFHLGEEFSRSLCGSTAAAYVGHGLFAGGTSGRCDLALRRRNPGHAGRFCKAGPSHAGDSGRKTALFHCESVW
jgi:hypothetical protein